MAIKKFLDLEGLTKYDTNIKNYIDTHDSDTDTHNVAYGTCTTAAAAAEKVVTLSGAKGWTLTPGATVTVKFTNTNTANNPKLKVGSTDAKSILYNTSVITTSSLSMAGVAGRYITYVYDGTQYVFNGWSIDTDFNTTYSVATQSANGLMSSTDKTKLDGIATGAEVNQNAFSNVVVGSTTIAADSKTDTLTLAAGANVTLTPNATNDTITIAATDTTYANATQSAAGLMSAADKKKLDGIDGTSGEVTLTADWAENDSSVSGYIANRTHYVNEVGEVVTLDDKYLSESIPRMDGGSRQLTYNTNGESFDVPHHYFGTVTYRKVSDEVFSRDRLSTATYTGIYSYYSTDNNISIPYQRAAYAGTGGVSWITDYIQMKSPTTQYRTMLIIVSVSVPGTYRVDLWDSAVNIPAAGTYFLDASSDANSIRITSMTLDQDYLIKTEDLPDIRADWNEANQESVNYVKGRTHYATYDTLRFEGSDEYPNHSFRIEVTSSVYTTFYKVSSTILTEKQLRDSVIGYTFEQPDAQELLPPHTINYATDNQNAYFFFDDQMIGVAVAKAAGTYNISYMGMTFIVRVPSAGTYFSSYGGGYYTTLSCKYATDVYQLGEQYLPDTVPTMELSGYNYTTLSFTPGVGQMIGVSANGVTGYLQYANSQMLTSEQLLHSKCKIYYNSTGLTESYEQDPQTVYNCIGQDGRHIVGTSYGLPLVASFGAPGTYVILMCGVTISIVIPNAGTYVYTGVTPAGSGYVNNFEYASSGNYALKEENLPTRVQDLLEMIYAEEEEAGF